MWVTCNTWAFGGIVGKSPGGLDPLVKSLEYLGLCDLIEDSISQTC